MNTTKFAELKNRITSMYNELYNQYNEEYESGFSDNNAVLTCAQEHFNDLVEYYNTVKDGHILNAFKDEYGEQTLKDSSIKKLIEWLKDEDISYLFEDEFLIKKGCDYYMSKNACLMYKNEEPEEDLNYWLDGDKLTEKHVFKIESLTDGYINEDQSYLYIHGVSFEFTLPKAAILRAYKAHFSNY